MAIAHVVDAKWIRIFEWVNAYISHAGIIEGIGSKVARYKENLKDKNVRFFCDANVKHGSHFIISDRTVVEQAKDVENEGADSVIITGFETGVAPSPKKIKTIKEEVNIPVIIGSGVNLHNVKELFKYADGAIVGSEFKVNGCWKNELDKKRIEAFINSINKYRQSI